MSETTKIVFTSSAGEASGFLARPASSGRAGIVVIQEWWGIVPHIEDVTRRFAAEGYVALAPDLYHGKSTVDAEEASHLMEGLDWARAAKEIAGAVAYLRETEGVTHVGIVGFCMGGALSVIGASVAQVDAFVSFYGFPPAGACDLTAITAPGQIFFGDREGFFSIPDAQAFAETQSAKGIPTEVSVYEDADHAFFNDTRPEVYKASAATDAYARTLAHFARYLSV